MAWNVEVYHVGACSEGLTRLEAAGGCNQCAPSAYTSIWLGDFSGHNFFCVVYLMGTWEYYHCPIRSLVLTIPFTEIVLTINIIEIQQICRNIFQLSFNQAIAKQMLQIGVTNTLCPMFYIPLRCSFHSLASAFFTEVGSVTLCRGRVASLGVLYGVARPSLPGVLRGTLNILDTLNEGLLLQELKSN